MDYKVGDCFKAKDRDTNSILHIERPKYYDDTFYKIIGLMKEGGRHYYCEILRIHSSGYMDVDYKEGEVLPQIEFENTFVKLREYGVVSISSEEYEEARTFFLDMMKLQPTTDQPLIDIRSAQKVAVATRLVREAVQIELKKNVKSVETFKMPAEDIGDFLRHLGLVEVEPHFWEFPKQEPKTG